FRRLVIVREDDGATLLLQPVDGGDIGRVDRPFEGRNELLHLFVEVLRLAGDLGREGKVRFLDDTEALRGGERTCGFGWRCMLGQNGHGTLLFSRLPAVSSISLPRGRPFCST